MRRSRTELYVHVVWSTYLRTPLLRGRFAQLARQVVRSEARALGCEVLALDGIADHLHLVTRIPARLSIAELMKQAKGASSRALNESLPHGEGFGWQEGYGAFSVSRSHLKRVIDYVEQQEQRHAQNQLWPEWEETDEEKSA